VGTLGRQYRIYAGESTNVGEIDEKGRPTRGLWFTPRRNLPVGDVMLSQKTALECRENCALEVARRFAPTGFMFRRSRLIG
jgi:hypothetical protein